MKISIVIPAFNEEKLIGATLASVRDAASAFEKRGWAWELIVCDNNSTDRTAEVSRAAGATVVFEPVNQIGRARNRGAEAAGGEWLIFVDADSHPSAALFDEVAVTTERGRHAGGGCVVRLDESPWVASTLVGVWNLISRVMRWAAGSFIFCETATFRAVGGFSTDFFVGEEIDLSQRLRRKAREGGRDLKILHRHPLVTSARKIHLYSPWEHLGFMLRAGFFPSRTLRDRSACQPWYDGRR